MESAPSAFTGSVADAAVRLEVTRGGLSFVLRFEDEVPSDGGLIKERENGAAAIRVMLLVE